LISETVLVTGGAGFIGPKVVELLLKNGYRVIVLDKLTYAARVKDGEPLSLNMVLDSLGDAARERCSFIKCDVADLSYPLSALFEAERVDNVIHMAAESHVDRSTDGKPDFIQTEIYGTYNLLRAIRDQNSGGKHRVRRAVFVSTDEVYGSIDRIAGSESEKCYELSDSGVSGVIRRHEFTEATPLAGGSPYAASKAGADLLVGAFFNTFKWDTERGVSDPDRMPVMITRGVNNFGPFQHPEKLIPLAICTLLMPDVSGVKRRIPIYDKGLAVREWLHTEDYARAIVHVMRHGQPGEVYNAGSGNRCRNRDLLLAIFRACRPHIPNASGFHSLGDAAFDATTLGGVARPGHDLCYAVNCNKLQELGWRPELASNFEERIDDAVEWYVRNRDWWTPVWTDSGFAEYWNRKYGRIMDASRGAFQFYTPHDETRSLGRALL
jgi:dTDP-glucose 4,6-dehydratase